MNSMEKPLSGIKVLDLTRFYAGPFCTMQLGDLGADVVKVEMPGGDPLRHQGPPFLQEQSMSFLSANRNKRSITLDMKTPEGKDTLIALAAKADVLVENFRSGVMDRYGLGYEKLSMINPRLVYGSLSGFGSGGPYHGHGAFDLIVQAEFGYMSITGEKNGAPVKQGTSVFDLACGLYGSLGILAALQQRHKTGRGQHVETSMMEGEISFLVDAAMDYFVTGKVRSRWGSEHSNIVPYKVFEASDGYLAIGAGYDNLFAKFVHVIGMPQLLDDARFATHSNRIVNRVELYEQLDANISKKTVSHLLAALRSAGIPCSAVNDMKAVFDHPQVRHQNMQVMLPNSRHEPVPSLGSAIKYSDFEITDQWTAPPALGEHTEAVLRDWLDR